MNKANDSTFYIPTMYDDGAFSKGHTQLILILPKMCGECIMFDVKSACLTALLSQLSIASMFFFLATFLFRPSSSLPFQNAR